VPLNQGHSPHHDAKSGLGTGFGVVDHTRHNQHCLALYVGGSTMLGGTAGAASQLMLLVERAAQERDGEVSLSIGRWPAMLRRGGHSDNAARRCKAMKADRVHTRPHTHNRTHAAPQQLLDALQTHNQTLQHT